MSEKLTVNYANNKASELIRTICVPAGCEMAVTPIGRKRYYTCSVLPTRSVVIALEGRFCNQAVVQNQPAAVSKKGVLLR